MKLYRSGSTEAYSNSSKDVRVVEDTLLFARLVWDCGIRIWDDGSVEEREPSGW